MEEKVIGMIKQNYRSFAYKIDKQHKFYKKYKADMSCRATLLMLDRTKNHLLTTIKKQVEKLDCQSDLESIGVILFNLGAMQESLQSERMMIRIDKRTSDICYAYDAIIIRSVASSQKFINYLTKLI